MYEQKDKEGMEEMSKSTVVLLPCGSWDSIRSHKPPLTGDRSNYRTSVSILVGIRSSAAVPDPATERQESLCGPVGATVRISPGIFGTPSVYLPVAVLQRRSESKPVSSCAELAGERQSQSH